MPSNKKPRHKRQNRLETITPDKLAGLKKLFEHFELVAYITLPAGNMTRLDMNIILDYFVLFSFSITNRANRNLPMVIDAEALNEFAPIYMAGFEALNSLGNRGHANGDRYIATGDEMKALNAALPVMCDYFHECLNSNPRLLARELDAMSGLTASSRPGSITPEMIRRKVDKTF